MIEIKILSAYECVKLASGLLGMFDIVLTFPRLCLCFHGILVLASPSS